MSEPTLYRINDSSLGGDQVLAAQDILILESLVSRRVLVPVERCEHGNIDPHYYLDGYGTVGPSSKGAWLCPGAGIGGDDGPE